MTGFQEYEVLEPGVPPAGTGEPPEPAGLKRHLKHFRKGGLANDTAWGATHDLTQLFVMTATFILLSRHLGQADYGRYAGVYGIVGPVAGLTWSGVTLAVLQRRLRERDDVATVARKFLLLTLLMSVVATAVGTLIGSATIGGMAVSTIVAVMVAELIANGINAVLLAMVQADKGFAPATRLRLVTLGIRVTVLVTLTVTGSLAVGHLAIGYSIGFFAYFALLATVILPRYGIPFLLGLPDKETARLTSSIALPIAAGVLQQDGDKTVLNSYGFHSEAGLYAAAFRVVSMGLMPLRALEGAAFQRFLPHNENERNEHTRRATRFSMLALGISLVIGVGILICRPLLHIIIGKEFAGAERMIPWLLPFLPLTAVSNAPSNGLLGLGKLGVRASIYTASALVSLTLYITMIPLMPDGQHWKGAVIGTIVGEAFLATAGWTALRHFQRKHNESLDRAEAAVDAEPPSHTYADPQPPPPYDGPIPVHAPPAADA